MKKGLLTYFGFFYLLLSSVGLSAQNGCTDPQAQNYDNNALVNDGSCIYTVTTYSLQLIANLTGSLDENSGFIYSNSRIFSINDGGNGTKIQELGLQGNIVRTIHVDSTQNMDWEAIGQSESTVYIGDFGNNGGNRTDLHILQLNKNALQNLDTVQPSKIHFSYSDQLNFTTAVNQNNFDCEAFFFYRDSLHLFTKGWENLYTKHYVIPLNNEDSVQAQLQDSLFVDGLITDATMDTTTGRVLLLGYKNNGSNFYTSFVYLLFDYNQTHFFTGNKRRIEIGNMLTVSQTEGIAFESSTSGFITAEKITSSFITVSPKLFHFDFTSYFENFNVDQTILQSNEIRIYPNPATQSIQLTDWSNMQGIEIIDCSNRLVLKLSGDEISKQIDISHLLQGTYFVRITKNNEVITIPVINK
jgi:hypothetical protein